MQLRPHSESGGFGGLLVLDDCCHARAARFALERALVVIRLVGLKSHEPHRHSARFAARMLNFRRVGNVVRLSHSDSLAVSAGGSATASLSHQRLRQSLGR